MRKSAFKFHPSFLILVVTLTSATAIAQIAIPNPLLVLQDADGDTATLPLLGVYGGAHSSTLGVEIKGQTTTGAPGTAPSFSFINPGFGGLSLVQLGTTSTGVSSPFLSLCAQQEISTVLTPECWSFQVSGGNGNNVPDLFALTRTSNQANVTFQLPYAINLVAGLPTTGGQMTIGAPPASAPANLSGIPITVVGGFSKDTTGSAAAAPLQLFPGFLTSPASGALEGALQIGMAVMGTPAMGNQYLLACYSSTQTASPCTSSSQPLLGVYLVTFAGCPSNCGTGGSSAVIAPPSRATVMSTSLTSGVWTFGTPVCRDPAASVANPGLVIIESSGAPCPIGQAVGISVGDPSGTTTTHVIDLNFSDQGVTSSGTSTTYATAASSLNTAPAGNLLASDGNGNVRDSGTVAGGFFWALCNGTVGTASVAAYIFFPSQTSITTCTATTAGGGDTEMPMPVACTARNLAVAAGTGGAVAGSSVRLFHNGSASGLVCALGTNTSCIDATHTVSFAAQDTWSVRAVPGQANDTMANLKATFQCN